jgi:hypothetical protein
VKSTLFGKKHYLALLAMILALLLGAGYILDGVLFNQAQSQIDANANLLMDSMLAVREYTSKEVNPIVDPINREESTFLPEAVPSYSATRVFSYLVNNKNYKDFSYREATLNPTNLKDKADPFEAQIVEIFRADPNLKIQSGVRHLNNVSLHYLARPLTVSKASCLECHSTPERAPRSHLAMYGSISGFGWHLHEIVGAQIVSVPVEAVLAAKQTNFTTIVAVFFLALVLLSLLILALSRQVDLNRWLPAFLKN